MYTFLIELWNFTVISAPYLLLGFLISGFMRNFLNKDIISAKLKNSKKTDFIWSSLLGVPLPLCSCSVVPSAATLRKSGASNAATSSFLISTPESGVDSIAISYGILDLPMTVLRPIIAFITAFIAGALNKAFNDFEYINDEEKTSCCHNSKKAQEKNPILKALKFGFVELLDDMINWLVIGLILGALVSILIPDGFFNQFSSNTNRLLILLIGIPTYICASASTPVAASLILKGLSPGAALLFLMVGPATNISNIAVIQKYIGKKGVIINLLTIAFVSLAFSYAVDYAYLHFWENSIKFTQSHDHSHQSVFEVLCAIVFIILAIGSLKRVNFSKNKGHSH